MRIANNTVRRVLVDNGSSTVIDVLNRVRLDEAVLKPIQTPLYRFVGECICLEGTITLPVTIGDEAETITRMVKFIVVNKPSVYNIILKRLTLNAIKVVMSIYHLVMKFSTPTEVETFKGSQQEA